MRKRKLRIKAAYIFSPKVIIHSLERQQTKKLAQKHCTGLHKWMLKWSNLPVRTLRFESISPSTMFKIVKFQFHK